MIDLGPEFHSRRALKQAEQRAIDERLAHEDHRRALESDPIHQASLAAELEEHRRITDGFDGLTKEEQVDVLAGVPLSVGERAKLAFGRLGMGLALGGMSTGGRE